MRFFGKAIVAGLLAGFGLPACGNDLACGEGTIKVGDFCVVDTGESDADTDADADSDTDSGNTDNLPPSQPTVVISPTAPTESDDLTCIVSVDSIDADGDPVTYRFVWFKNDAPSQNHTSNYGAENTASGDTLLCRVTPNDGAVDGPSGLAAVTIQ